jgi:hypothetical protein
MRTRQTSKSRVTVKGVPANPPESKDSGEIPTIPPAEDMAVSLSNGSANESLIERTQSDWIQQMHDCEAMGWRGGDAFYDGQ